MIIDLCPFYSETDLLLLRLQTHTNTDKFYIYEFSTDFRGEPKPLHYLNNIALFKDFQDRIIYRNFDFLQGSNACERSQNYRDVIQPEIMHLRGDTIVLNTDTDEILRPEAISRYKEGYMCPELDWYVYYMNLANGKWMNGCICQVKDLQGFNLSELRYNHFRGSNPSTILYNAGWHFSWLGGHKWINEKYHNFKEYEQWPVGLTDEVFVNDLLKRKVKFWDNQELKLVSLDNHPEYLVNNIDKFKPYLYDPQS